MSENIFHFQTTQPFDDVVRDLGQVLQIRNARKMYTKDGIEIRGFSHLRNDFRNEKTFLIAAESGRFVGPSYPNMQKKKIENILNIRYRYENDNDSDREDNNDEGLKNSISFLTAQN